MEIKQATVEKRGEIINLLKEADLPYEDLPGDLSGFCTANENEKVLGLIGMERYGMYGLLRSMVVDPSYRNRHIAERLVNTLEEKAKSTGIHQIYLLTETAEHYFSRKGYEKINRESVPEQLLQSSEFSHVCPVSATVMKKTLTH